MICDTHIAYSLLCCIRYWRMSVGRGGMVTRILYIPPEIIAKLYRYNIMFKFDTCWKIRVIEQIFEIEYNIKNKEIECG